MDFLNKLRKYKSPQDINSEYDSFWTLSDDCSQTSLSTTSLSIDTDEFKYMDDDSDSSSSDEIYSLETSLIEMNKIDEPFSLEEKSTHNQNWCHQPTPIIGRSINFYDNDNFADDTLSQLANKGFAQSLSRQTFTHKNIYQPDDTPLEELLSLLKDKCWLDTVNGTSTSQKLPPSDGPSDHSFELDLMDNEDLQSISSHGSDRSATPVDTRSSVHEEAQKYDNSTSTIVDPKAFIVQSTFNRKTSQQTKTKLLIFSDTEDIESVDDESKRNSIHEDDENVDDEEDRSTICGDRWNDYQDIEVYKETLYHQPPKSADRSAAQRLARRLFDLRGFKLTDVSKHLSKRNDFSQMVGEEFANFFDFCGMPLDVALRVFLEKFVLCGDTQERERVVHHFSRRYMQCNPGAYDGEESCHTLVCAIMLLNTDLHGNTINRKMSCQDFVVSMSDLNNGQNFNNEELVKLFNSIFDNPIRWNIDNELIGLIQPKVDYTDFNKQINTSNFNFYLEVPSEATSKEYMSGYLLRKCIKESHFRRTSIGKRGWKLYFGRLQDLTLYLHKDETSINGSLRRSSRKLSKEKELCKNGNSYSDPVLTKISPNDVENPDIKINGSDCKKTRRTLRFPRVKKRISEPSSSQVDSEENKSCSQTERNQSNTYIDSIGTLQIYLNHAFASKATDYSKKRNVFRLQVSSGSEYLFQVNEPREVELWVDCLNFVAALLSPPVFSNPSNKDIPDSYSKNSNPALTTMNIKEQLESHQRCVLTLEQDLIHLNSKPPLKSDKTKLKWQYNRQRKFIERELIRYKTYSRLLEFELIHLHNLAIARMSQQAFIDPYLIPVQYSQMSGVSPLFYNQQTNQFVPMNCVSANVPVFQYHPGYGGPQRTVNNSSLKELCEESSSQATVSPQEQAVSVQPVIVRSSYSCGRPSRSQMNINKRRRYRNSSLQQQQPTILMHYNPSVILPPCKKQLLKPVAPSVDNDPDINAENAPYPQDCAQESLTLKNSGNNNSITVQPNGTTFYEIL